MKEKDKDIVVKQLYAISINGTAYMISLIDKDLIIGSFKSNYEDNMEQKKIINVIQENLSFCKKLNMHELRLFLVELQGLINNTSTFDMEQKVEEFFNIQFGEKRQQQLNNLKQQREQLISQYFDAAHEEEYKAGSGNDTNTTSFIKNKQKVKSNGKSVLPHDGFMKLGKDAFVNALVLATIVELVSMFLVTILLLKI